MQKKKIIILMLILLLLAILLIIGINSRKINLISEQNKMGETELTIPNTNEANPPVLSAGMIPVKWNGRNWVITKQDDKTWYDYSRGEPAYIMLNDGVYQSELMRDMTGKKLAKENIGNQIQETELGSIYMWIPRFAINENNEDIKYIKNTESTEAGWTIPEIFLYEQASTLPDFILAGIWIEKDTDTNYASKITQMNKEESIYEFLANTKAEAFSKKTLDKTAIQKYVEKLNSNTNELITDIANTNRIILKIINQGSTNTIKATATYSSATKKITARVTYAKNEISKIILNGTEELEITNTDGIITAETGEILLEGEEDKVCTITVIDNKENKKEIKVVVRYIPEGPIYATFYTDGTLALANNKETKIEGKEVSNEYDDISTNSFTSASQIPWYSNRTKITSVEIVDKIAPISTAYWFYGSTKLTEIKNIENLYTNNVTNMRYMFYNCSGLTSLDVSSFDTSNVTNMQYLFAHCSGLTSLDVSSFDTSNVTNMFGMFYDCKGLTELDVSNFDTSNVTSMGSMFSGSRTIYVGESVKREYMSLEKIELGNNFNTSKVTNMANMFAECSSLTSIDLSSFNTSKVTNMASMFADCSSLISLDLSNFDTSNVTGMDRMFENCSSLISLDVSSFNTSKVTGMDRMFENCSSLTSLDVGNFNAIKAIDTRRMFYNCRSLTSLKTSNFATSSVERMDHMFYNCKSLTSLDLSKFYTGKAYSMRNIFDGCTNLTYLNIRNFDVSNTKYGQGDVSTIYYYGMQYMFYNCTKLTTIYVNTLTTYWPTTVKNNTTSSTNKYYNMFTGCGTQTVTRVN